MAISRTNRTSSNRAVSARGSRETLSRAKGRRAVAAGSRGFTFIEISVVVLVLALIAAVIMPNFVAQKRSRDLYYLEASIVRLPAEARNEARRAQVPVTLRVADGALVMERVPPDNTSQPVSISSPGTVTQLGGPTQPQSAMQQGGAPQEVKRVALSGDITIDGARQNGNTIDSASWQWTVYPDGSADSGGLEFAEGAAKKSLVLTGNGGVQWISGGLPDTTQESWPAGELLQRG